MVNKKRRKLLTFYQAGQFAGKIKRGVKKPGPVGATLAVGDSLYTGTKVTKVANMKQADLRSDSMFPHMQIQTGSQSGGRGSSGPPRGRSKALVPSYRPKKSDPITYRIWTKGPFNHSIDYGSGGRKKISNSTITTNTTEPLVNMTVKNKPVTMSRTRTKNDKIDDFDQARSHHAKEVAKEITSPVKGIDLDSITSPSGTTMNEKPIPAVTKNGKKKMALIGQTEPKEAHKIQVETGYKASKVLRQIAKENGIVRQVLYDTKMWSPVDGVNLFTPILREMLNHACGFNTRNWWVLPSRAFVTIYDLKKAFQTNQTDDSVVLPQDREVTVYGSFMEAESQITIYNQSAHLPMKVRIHLCHTANLNTDERTIPNEFAEDVFNTTSGTAVAKAIPQYFMTKAPSLEVGDTSDIEQNTQVVASTLISGKGLKSSPYFRENYKLEKTVSQKLLPGETLQFSHKHFFGGGVDMACFDKFINFGSNARLLTMPASYFPIIEVQGYPCEAVYQRTAEAAETRLGTSPGYYYAEFRKILKYVKASDKSTDIYDASAISGNVPVHTRTWVNDEMPSEDVQTRPFFALPENITTDTGIGGTTRIPIMSDLLQTYAVTPSGITQNDPN